MDEAAVDNGWKNKMFLKSFALLGLQTCQYQVSVRLYALYICSDSLKFFY